MSTTTLPHPVALTDAPAVERITLVGDFNCPWSYLAFRRADALMTAGVDIDWRAVEHLPELPWGGVTAPFTGVRDELERVSCILLPGEELPRELPLFLPRTAPAVAAYAEGYAARAAAAVARVLFESYWLHGIDIGDVYVLRTLLADELRDGASPSAPIREWGAPVTPTGGPISGQAHRLIQMWSDEWHQIGQGLTPVLQVPGTPEPIRGIAAVDWLGVCVSERGLDLDGDHRRTRHCWRGELPDLGWASGDGGRWHRRFQRCGAGARS